MAKNYNTQNDSAYLSAFFLVCSSRKFYFDFPVPSREEDTEKDAYFWKNE